MSRRPIAVPAILLQAVGLAAALAAAATARGADTALSATTTAARNETGTTIVGDQDAAVGLFLAPWKNEAREIDNRPPGLLDPELGIADPAAQSRVVEHQAASRAYRTEQVLRVR